MTEELIEIPETENKTSEELKSSETSRFFAEKISNLIENDSEENIKDLEKNLEKYIKRLIKKGLTSSVGEYDFLTKYFDPDEEKNLKLNGKFNTKFDRYFSIHKNHIIKNIISEILENGDINNSFSIHKIFKQNIKKYNQILFIFGEKIHISKLNILLQKDPREIQEIYDSYDNKLVAIKQNNKSNINAISTYRKILTDLLLNNKINISNKIEDELLELFNSQVEGLFEIFYKWKKTPFVDLEELEQIKNFSKDIFNLSLAFFNSNIAFSNKINVSKIDGNRKEKEEFINNFIKSFFGNINNRVENKEVKKNDKIRKENKELFEKFLRISINNGNFSELITEIKEYKKNKYKKEIPERKKQLKKEKISEIKEKISEIDFIKWYQIPDNQQYEIFFSKILYKKSNKLELNTKILEIDNISDNDIKNFLEYFGTKQKDISREIKALKNQFKNIKNNLSKVGSINAFIARDANDINLLLAWWNFILKKKYLKNNDEQINIKKLKDIEDKPYGVVNRITKTLSKKGIDNIEFLPSGDRLVNDSEKSIEKLIHDLKIKFEKGPIDINKNINNIESKDIKLKELTDLYIKGNFEDTIKNNHLGLLVANKLSSNERITNLLELEFVEKLKKYKIIPENYESLDIKELDNLKELKEFLKYINYNSKILKEMIEIGNIDRKRLEKFIPNSNKSKYTGIGSEKDFGRALEKLILDHNGDFAPLGDFTRMRITNPGIITTIDSVVEFIEKANNDEDILQVAIIDYTKNPLEKPKKASGYRDIKLLIKFSNGNVGEVQFQYEDMIEMKEKGIDLNNPENYFVFEKFESEGHFFTQEEINELINISKQKDLKLPKIEILEKLSQKGLDIKNDGIFSKEIISTQDTYNFARIFEDSEIGSIGFEINKKLSRFERILADIAWGKTVNLYLKNILNGTGVELD